MDVVRLRSKSFPGSKSFILLMQEYASGAYVTLFFVLSVVIYYRMANDLSILLAGIFGSFLLITFANIYGMVRMQKTFAEAGFTEGMFYLKSVSDIASGKPPLMFPGNFALPRREGDRLFVHYFGRVVTLNLSDWHDEDMLLIEFGKL